MGICPALLERFVELHGFRPATGIEDECHTFKPAQRSRFLDLSPARPNYRYYPRGNLEVLAPFWDRFLDGAFPPCRRHL